MASPAKRSLHALPQELLLEICDYLSWHTAEANKVFRPYYAAVGCMAEMREEAVVCQGGLDALGRTCRLLREVSLYVLYRGPCLLRADALRRLLQTLDARPDLAAAVVELHDLRLAIDDSVPGRDDTSELEEAAYHDPVHASLAVVALTRMPNLTRAHLCIPGQARFVPASLFPGANDRDSSQPTSLRTLALSSPDPYFQLALGHHCLFQHPALADVEHVHIHDWRRPFSDADRAALRAADLPPAPLVRKLVSLTLTRALAGGTRMVLLVAVEDLGGVFTRLDSTPLFSDWGSWRQFLELGSKKERGPEDSDDFDRFGGMYPAGHYRHLRYILKRLTTWDLARTKWQESASVTH